MKISALFAAKLGVYRVLWEFPDFFTFYYPFRCFCIDRKGFDYLLIAFCGHLTICRKSVFFKIAPFFSEFTQVFKMLCPGFCAVFSEISQEIDHPFRRGDHWSSKSLPGLGSIVLMTVIIDRLPQTPNHSCIADYWTSDARPYGAPQLKLKLLANFYKTSCETGRFVVYLTCKNTGLAR